jgi:hypothetical protein
MEFVKKIVNTFLRNKKIHDNGIKFGINDMVTITPFNLHGIIVKIAATGFPCIKVYGFYPSKPLVIDPRYLKLWE